jgi:hypothetical protein
VSIMPGVTNFSSVVSVSTIGTADVERLAQSFDKLSGSIDSATEKGNKLAAHPGFDDFASKVKAGIQDPLGAAGDAVEGLLGKLGPMGTAVAAGFGIFTAAAAGVFEMAKSLGEYGIQIRDVELRTGLSAKEVGQFGFAAKAVGQDVSVFERTMRGLTMAIEDQSPKGEKARATLRGFGVDIAEVRAGTASTADVLIKVSEGLNALPTAFDRNQAALDLFKRGGIEAVPVLMELNENLAIAREHGFGPDDIEISKLVEYGRQVAIIETSWAGIVRHIKEALVGGVAAQLAPLNATAARQAADQAKANYDAEMAKNRGAMSPQALDLYTRWQALDAASAAASASDARRQVPGAVPIAPNTDTAFMDAAAQKRLAELTPGSFTGLYSIPTRPASLDATIANLMGGVGGPLEEQLRVAKEKLGGMKLEQGNSSEPDVAAFEKQKEVVEGIENEIRNRKMALEITKQQVAEIEKYAKEYNELQDKAQTKMFEGGFKTLHENITEQYGGTPGMNAADAAQLFQFEAGQTALSFARMMMQPKSSNQQAAELLSGYIDQVQQTANPMAVRNLQDQQRRSLALFSGQATLAGVPQGAQIGGQYAMRLNFADQIEATIKAEADLDTLRAASIDDEKQRVAELEAAKKKSADAEEMAEKERFDAQMERDQALLEMANHQKEGFQSFAQGAFSALVSGARSREGAGPALDKYLENELVGMADKVVGGLAGMAWNTVRTSIPHANDPNSTWGKLLQGTPFAADPLKLATADNTTATIANNVKLDALTAALQAGGYGGEGGSGPASYINWATGGGIYSGAGGGASAPGFGGGGASGPASYINWATGTGPDAYNLSMAPYMDFSTAPQAALRGPTMGLGNYLGIGTALAAGGMGIYSGIQAGGPQGDLEAAGSAAGMVGGIMSQLSTLSSTLSSTLGPIGMALGAGLGIASLMFGNPKQERATQETDTAVAARYTAPTPTHYISDVYGQASAMTMNGGFQPIQMNLTVNALDSQSVLDRATDIGNAVSTVIEGNMSPRLSTALRNTVSPQ